LVTPDEIGDVASLNLELSVNGEVRQKANTKDMLFNVPDIIAFISRFMTLHPGDLIVTGTPPGVVLGMTPQVYMKPGDKMSLMIDGLGAQSQKIVASEHA
jgi:2,4-diketo-3-deoxy-L-fuconate hydrolase